MQFKPSSMRLAVLLGLAQYIHSTPLHAHSQRQTFDLTTATLEDIASHALGVATSRLSSGSSTCTSENVRVRKSFESLTDDEKIAYTGALNCLMTTPARTPSDLVPGAKSRYDDFVATHINQTEVIHLNAAFLGWHRWYIWEMESALRDECGYTGPFPYWDWVKTEQEGFANSAMFDGSETSMSGNGLQVNYTTEPEIVLYPNTTGEIRIPGGPGGGCVTEGPFANMTVNLGPVQLSTPDGGTAVSPSGDNFAYNPRCLKRALNDYALHRYVNTTSLLSLLRNTSDVWWFEDLFSGTQGVPEMGAHAGGHFAFGGDPGMDFYVSPGEPAFFVHHTNVDRVWWMWQMLDPDVRGANVETAVNGPITMWDVFEPHGNGTISTMQNLGYVKEGAEVPLGELMSTTEGLFCYVYE
ncbi:hypothetical protein CkaCkLH20_04336 [Colletotrichum karsti]|uniref:Tyrosinase copper-binding domain-containing protein n=1 Tax=Colletotrichum karsti TaxID=1095194 RepID=A0A9P6I8G8_9PEZI|nr:uncharacterized protein CkaCkLH20_04336 [Colletotrichum karsti]KAF9878298.1 hypothetical protein CkaCkLH20_04336 [Colletotrichum karsti]